jgi:hypothetical protein
MGWLGEMILNMKLDFGARLGIAGLVLGLFSVAAFYIWPEKKWIGWVCLVMAVALILAWGLAEIRTLFKSGENSLPTPSLVFVFGVPLGDNASSLWMMVLRHFGPESAHNCTISFYDKDRKNIEHLWLVNNGSPPFLPAGQFDASQHTLYVLEANPQGVVPGNFQWSPLDPDRQHYEVTISCRDGYFIEHWEVTRVDGILRSAITIERGPQWVQKNPNLNPVVFSCKDPEFISSSLATEILKSNTAKIVHPGWKPNHTFALPVAIIDPNGHIQVAGVKQSNGSILAGGPGSWAILAKHFGDAHVQPQ